jgi:peroxiredoxin
MKIGKWIALLVLNPGLVLAAVPAVISGTEVGRVSAPKLELNPAAQTTVVVFLSAKCPCSAGHMEALRALASEYSKTGIRFVGVHSNADETAEFAAPVFHKLRLPFPVVHDPGAKIADAYGALKTPHVFVVHHGEIVFSGGVDDSQASDTARKHYLRDALGAVAAGRKPEHAQVRALGCQIKRP